MNQKKHAIILGVASIILFIPSATGNLETGILPNEQKSSFLERPIQLVGSMLKVGFYELGQLFVLDRILLLMLGLSVLFSVINFSRASSRLFLLTLSALWITGAVNGTIGVNFRYQLPLLPFIAYSILDCSKFNFEMVNIANPFTRRNKATLVD